MTREQFLEKCPRPWVWERTDPDGSGVIVAANGQVIARLCADLDWNDDGGRDERLRPVMNEDAERGALLRFLFEQINLPSD